MNAYKATRSTCMTKIPLLALVFDVPFKRLLFFCYMSMSNDKNQLLKKAKLQVKVT